MLKCCCPELNGSGFSHHISKSKPGATVYYNLPWLLWEFTMRGDVNKCLVGQSEKWQKRSLGQYTLRKKGAKRILCLSCRENPQRFSIRTFKGSMDTIWNLIWFSKQVFRTLKRFFKFTEPFMRVP